MPKRAAYSILWKEQERIYILSLWQESKAVPIATEGQEWINWLDEVSSFSFQGKSGFSYTVRKEQKIRGKGYWYAYRRIEGRLAKRYLGASSYLTLARLEQVELEFASDQKLIPRLGESETVPSSSANVSFIYSFPYLEGMFPEGEPLVVTKILLPKLRSRTFQRLSLIERLQRGVEGLCTLVCAPAGFGKTTLITSWLAADAIPVAWFSLGAEDNNPIRFISYLIASLRMLNPLFGATVLPLLQKRSAEPLETMLTLLINELSVYSGPRFALVLDNYDMITMSSIRHGLTFLLEHLPIQVHVIIITRIDPGLPLSRLRGRGYLTEIYADKLRFSLGETEQFLASVMKLKLSVREREQLHLRTEGWIAGIQFAAQALQEQANVSAFLLSFTGTHEWVLHYLSEEVFARQSVVVQNFLVQTSILRRLCAPLCQVVTGREYDQSMLEQLKRLNLFLVSLDDEQHWYRYHHLFADFLQRCLIQKYPELILTLHQRASIWYEQNELLIYAVHHAFASFDFDRAARLMIRVDPSAVVGGEIHQAYLDWLRALPAELLRQHPILLLHYALILAYSDQLAAAGEHLNILEISHRENCTAEDVHIQQGRILSLRASFLLYYGDLVGCIELADQAVEMLPVTEAFGRPRAFVMSVLAYCITGDVRPEQERYSVKAIEQARLSGDLSLVLRSMCNLAHLRVLQGNLREGAATYELAIQTISQSEEIHTLPYSPAYYFGVGDLLRERGELDAAETYLMQGIVLIDGGVVVDAPIVTSGYISLTLLLMACKRYREALTFLEQYFVLAHQRKYMPHLIAQMRAMQACVALYVDRTVSIDWARSYQYPKDELPKYLHEREVLTLARVQIVQAQESNEAIVGSETLSILERLLQEAEAKARLSSVLEILVLRALLFYTQARISEAQTSLVCALRLGESRGYLRLFADEGLLLVDLLRQLRRADLGPQAYIQALLNVCEVDALTNTVKNSPQQQDQSAFPCQLQASLSRRELEVMSLLASGASNREIACCLVISIGTVKRHISNLLVKLAAANRIQAVIQARRYGLLPEKDTG